MKLLCFFIAIVVINFSIVACSSGNSGKEADVISSTTSFDREWAKSFIDSSNAKISEQFTAGDSVGLASHYWPDAELLLSNSETIKGKDILSAWGSMTRMGIKEFSFSTTDITGDSEFLIETGNYEMKDDHQTLIDRGKYVVVWQQRNGVWKLYRDIGNTSLPASK